MYTTAVSRVGLYITCVLWAATAASENLACGKSLLRNVDRSRH